MQCERDSEVNTRERLCELYNTGEVKRRAEMYTKAGRLRIFIKNLFEKNLTISNKTSPVCFKTFEDLTDQIFTETKKLPTEEPVRRQQVERQTAKSGSCILKSY